MGSKIITNLVGSSSIDLSFIRDYLVTSSTTMPTVTLPSADIENDLRFKWIDGGTATNFRLRSEISPMIVNNELASNALFTEQSGVIELNIYEGVYQITCKGTYTIES